MRYDRRCKLIYYTKGEGVLGDSSKRDEDKTKLLPCHINDLSQIENTNLFGDFNPNAFKVHFQGIHKGFRYINLDDTDFTPRFIRHFHNSTVVIVG
ncbi:hypothetical protein [Listeria booriae]|uniref:Uncharacterized protein n=1 Tax=Listeria booriae TaxID=1552123 RepID=A0A7X1CXU0_9LIST|nr:hypothetical protein [Listeria booriae]MBC2115687.1 hypothetical protein [Listeria booriae]